MTDERKEQFTPGPWRAHRMRVYLPDRRNPLNVSFTEHTVDNACANAALIAAAPEMYDWQDDALEVMRCILQDQYTPYSIRKELEPLIERGEAIQKKAQNEQ